MAEENMIEAEKDSNSRNDIAELGVSATGEISLYRRIMELQLWRLAKLHMQSTSPADGT